MTRPYLVKKVVYWGLRGRWQLAWWYMQELIVLSEPCQACGERWWGRCTH